MNIKTVLLAAASALLMAGGPGGCADSSESTPTEDVIDIVVSDSDVKNDGQSIPFESVDVGMPSNGADVRIITSSAGFRSTFGTAPPASLDLRTSWLAVVVGGSNQRIAVESMTKNTNTLFLAIKRETSTAANCTVPNPQSFTVVKFAKPRGISRARYRINNVSIVCPTPSSNVAPVITGDNIRNYQFPNGRIGVLETICQSNEPFNITEFDISVLNIVDPDSNRAALTMNLTLPPASVNKLVRNDDGTYVLLRWDGRQDCSGISDIVVTATVSDEQSTSMPYQLIFAANDATCRFDDGDLCVEEGARSCDFAEAPRAKICVRTGGACLVWFGSEECTGGNVCQGDGQCLPRQ
jgi:hypothetical protein